MNKQIKKLNLNKTTISNLRTSEMHQYIGGYQSKGNGCDGGGTFTCTEGAFSCYCSYPAGCSYTTCNTLDCTAITCNGHTCNNGHKC